MKTESPALQYLQDHGLDPDRVISEGHSSVWYRFILQDEEGFDIFAGDEPVYVHRPWPEGFDYEEFIEISEKEGLL